uniref:Phenylalanyl-tRNA synthetase domain-containing protein n=1 Tax=Amphimedon queenslandica TaxID=400682 RepID=A0A1X7TK69_AMPQE
MAVWLTGWKQTALAVSESLLKPFFFDLCFRKPKTNIVCSDISDACRSKRSQIDSSNSFEELLATGHLHPLLKVRTEIRQIFLEMGFCEMPTNNFIESSFWNFDALFQPQQHPVGDAHNTFFLKDPQFSYDFPTEYLERVKTMHQTGGHGSIGYQYDWKLEEAQKNILWTHTTAVSTNALQTWITKGVHSC